ncbi:exo-alpha-sialidase [candidate division KSB1 bacterium]|nr:exo-alpha-sialidase [candidate division KSB1 bacterium]
MKLYPFENISRRKFLAASLLSPVACFAGSLRRDEIKERKSEMIANIERQIIWQGRSTGPTWFHPRACRIPATPNPTILMTCQKITGSDVFHEVHWSVTKDKGKSWIDPEPIASLGRQNHPDGIAEGTCDVVPEYHQPTDTVLAIGHNVYYQNNVLIRAHSGRFPVYVVRDAEGRWSERKKLVWDHPETSGIYTCGCAQRIHLDDGKLILSLSFGPAERPDRGVCTVLCEFDGAQLRIIDSGNVLRLSVNRGLLEPSLTRYDGRFYMTIRAEDGHGYVSTSENGLQWQAQRPWCWDDGEPLVMSTTQQHWLTHSDGLFLVYTRKAEHNINVMRWRAPLYLAQVDPETLRLRRNTEKVVLPLIGDGINEPEHVARMGNFHVVDASQSESWVTVGETLPQAGWRGDTLLARIQWKISNKLLKS